MECVQSQTIEKKIAGEELRLENLVVAGKKYSLNITNRDDGRFGLFLEFNKDKHPDYFSVPEYKMVITEEGIRFERYVSGPSPDYCDPRRDVEIQSLQVIVDPEKALDPDAKKGELVWRARSPYKGEGYEYFYVPFGGVGLDD